jgi:hypothetical protein
MIECTFELNDKPMSLFKMGSMQFPAFSGKGDQINRRAFACNPNLGPIPPGAYYILDRQSGGLLGPLRDLYSDKSDWFALYAIDTKIDDEVFCDSVKRGNFRLHPKAGIGVSKGCITVATQADFNTLRATLKAVGQESIPGSTLKVYGRVTVR